MLYQSNENYVLQHYKVTQINILDNFHSCAVHIDAIQPFY
jgi:hypothetical protein